MIIDCKHVWNYISEYLDRTLPEETRDTVRKHLDHCEICSAILDSARNVIILTADDRFFELPVGFSERPRAHRSGVHAPRWIVHPSPARSSADTNRRVFMIKLDGAIEVIDIHLHLTEVLMGPFATGGHRRSDSTNPRQLPPARSLVDANATLTRDQRP
jgi:hypothetical protein